MGRNVMKHTKEILYSLILTLSLSFLLCEYSEVKATETNSTTTLSYNEQIELDYVDKPKRRSRQQAIERLRELSRWYPSLYFVCENEAKYPTDLLLTCAGNPEMADFLYCYPTADTTVNKGFTDSEQPEDHPLFLQFDPRWGYLPYGTNGNVASAGCGPTCLSMAIFYLTGDRNCTPGVISRYSLANGYYINGSGTLWSFITDYPKLYGLTAYAISYSEFTMKSELDKGNILIASARPGNFTSGGHFVLIHGYDENGFKINDPKCVYNSRLSWPYNVIRNDFKGMWTIGK